MKDAGTIIVDYEQELVAIISAYRLSDLQHRRVLITLSSFIQSSNSPSTTALRSNTEKFLDFLGLIYKKNMHKGSTNLVPWHLDVERKIILPLSD